MKRKLITNEKTQNKRASRRNNNSF